MKLLDSHFMNLVLSFVFVILTFTVSFIFGVHFCASRFIHNPLFGLVIVLITSNMVYNHLPILTYKSEKWDNKKWEIISIQWLRLIIIANESCFIMQLLFTIFNLCKFIDLMAFTSSNQHLNVILHSKYIMQTMNGVTLRSRSKHHHFP